MKNIPKVQRAAVTCVEKREINSLNNSMKPISWKRASFLSVSVY